MVSVENLTREHSVINDTSVHEQAIHEIVVAEGKQLVYEIDVHADEREKLTDRVTTITYRFVCKRTSMLILNILITGQVIAQHRVEIILEEPGAHATILGVCALNGRASHTIQLVQDHRAPHTMSSSLFHCALSGNALFTYNGMITIGSQAIGADAALYNKNMLRSPTAHAVAVPSLEVHTNAVSCKHGTATADCDKDQLIYMQTRGLDMHTAQKLLVQGFLNRFGLKQEQLTRILEQLPQQT